MLIPVPAGRGVSQRRRGGLPGRCSHTGRHHSPRATVKMSQPWPPALVKMWGCGQSLILLGGPDGPTGVSALERLCKARRAEEFTAALSDCGHLEQVSRRRRLASWAPHGLPSPVAPPSCRHCPHLQEQVLPGHGLCCGSRWRPAFPSSNAGGGDP